MKCFQVLIKVNKIMFVIIVKPTDYPDTTAINEFNISLDNIITPFKAFAVYNLCFMFFKIRLKKITGISVRSLRFNDVPTAIQPVPKTVIGKNKHSSSQRKICDSYIYFRFVGYITISQIKRFVIKIGIFKYMLKSASRMMR